MALLVVGDIKGVSGLRDSHLKQGTASIHARNAFLFDGTARPLPCPTFDAEHDCAVETLTKDPCPRVWCEEKARVVCFYPSDTRSQAIWGYTTAEGNPRIASTPQYCAGESYPLGMPVPDRPLIGGGCGGTCDCGTRPVSVRITYMREAPYLSESVPSVHSNEIVSCANGEVTVLIPPAPPGYGVDSANVYMSYPEAVGMDGIVRAEQGAGGYHLVAVGSPGSTISFTTDCPIGRELMTDEWYGPPDDLRCLIATPNGFAMGISGDSTIVISEPHQYHAFSNADNITIEHQALDLVLFGDTPIVLTDGPPYRLVYDQRQGAWDAYKWTHNLPLCSPGTVSVGQSGVYWESPNAIVAWNGREAPRQITDSVWNIDQYHCRQGERCNGQGEGKGFVMAGFYFWWPANRDFPGYMIPTGDGIYARGGNSLDRRVTSRVETIEINRDCWEPHACCVVDDAEVYFSLECDPTKVYRWTFKCTDCPANCCCDTCCGDDCGKCDSGICHPCNMFLEFGTIINRGLLAYKAIQFDYEQGSGDLYWELLAEEAGSHKVIDGGKITTTRPVTIKRRQICYNFKLRIWGCGAFRTAFLGTSRRTLAQEIRSFN